MKNHEFLDMLGEVNEDYIQAADSNVVRPRFRWGRWAAGIAACAALTAAAYPAFRAFQPQEPVPALVERPGLHPYVLVEDERKIVTTESKGPSTPFVPYAPVAEAGGDLDPEETSAPASGEQSGDIPVQKGAYCYERLLQGMGIPLDGSPAVYPEWFAGAWLEGEQGELLAVAIVEQDRTPELEAQIRGWAGGTVVFHNAKYSENYLNSLMDEISRIFDEFDCRISSVYGVYVMDNYLGLDFYGGTPADEVLAALAELDPEGDAIGIQVFTNGYIAFTDAAAESPAPGLMEPFAIDQDAGVTPFEGSEPVPGGVTHPIREEAAQMKEADQAAVYDLPQAKGDVILEGE